MPETSDKQRLLEPVPRLKKAIKPSGLFGPESAHGPIVLARAPGRLDVMGGVADYSGSLVCEMPLAVAAAAAAQARSDGQVVVRSAQEPGTVTLAIEDLEPPDPVVLRKRLKGESAWALYPIGCAWWFAQHGVRMRGRTILIDSDVPLGGGVSSSAAVEVATMSALAQVVAYKMSPLELAVACQAVENRVVGAPCGVMDQVTSSLGEAGSMLEILCQPGLDGLPAQVLGQVHVPKGYAFVGIHSGVRHEVSGDPYTDTRVAAFMGQKILSMLETPDPTSGCLARVDAARYQRELRGRLPESMTGRAFLDKYKATNDPVTTVRTEKKYAVRPAADHGVFEMMRVTRFVDLLKRAAGSSPGQPADLMRQAGELMVESHRSYSDCANLGHAMTDKLVEMVMAEGPKAGLLGAKITGGGCGGTVAAMIRDEPEARKKIAAIREQYTAQTGRKTMLFEGSGPGAAAWGTQAIRYEDLP